jgi:hypothetical protein
MKTKLLAGPRLEKMKDLKVFIRKLCNGWDVSKIEQRLSKTNPYDRPEIVASILVWAFKKATNDVFEQLVLRFKGSVNEWGTDGCSVVHHVAYSADFPKMKLLIPHIRMNSLNRHGETSIQAVHSNTSTSVEQKNAILELLANCDQIASTVRLLLNKVSGDNLDKTIVQIGHLLNLGPRTIVILVKDIVHCLATSGDVVHGSTICYNTIIQHYDLQNLVGDKLKLEFIRLYNEMGLLKWGDENYVKISKQMLGTLSILCTNFQHQDFTLVKALNWLTGQDPFTENTICAIGYLLTNCHQKLERPLINYTIQKCLLSVSNFEGKWKFALLELLTLWYNNWNEALAKKSKLSIEQIQQRLS